MTDRELMQMALDALANFDLDVRLKVMPALRARLAQPEKTNQCGETCERAKLCAVCAKGLAQPEQAPTNNGRYLTGYKAQPEQEPVAWMFPDDLERFETSETYAEVYSLARLSVSKGETAPLYTAPPQRKWVGLTDEEFKSICTEYKAPRNICLAIESALREKNT